MSAVPSPPGNGGLTENGLHQLVQHNSNTSYPQTPYEEGAHMHPYYGSPVPDDAYGVLLQQPRHPYRHALQDSGLNVHFEGYPHEYLHSVYQDRYSTPATSPPTPISSSEHLTTRSGLAIQRGRQNLRPMPQNRTRVDKSSKPKKVKKERVKAENKIAKITRPLSELTKDWTHVPVVDIEAYVSRSVDERRKEIADGKNPGKVKRPMNSFMLYRKAYQNRTKDWCLQNNHQVVSQVCGDSWPLEPDGVRDQFIEWARIERINHANAHPGYKFSPSKPGVAKGKRNRSEDSLSDESGLSDFEWQAEPRRGKKQRAGARTNQSVPYPTTKSAYHYSSSKDSLEPGFGEYNSSSIAATNSGRPVQPQYNQDNFGSGECYQPSGHDHAIVPDLQDFVAKKTEAPNMHSYLGLPGGHEYDMMSSYAPWGGPYFHDQRFDSSLMYQGVKYHEVDDFNSHLAPQDLFFGGSQNGDYHWQGSAFENNPIIPLLDPELTQEGSQIHDPHVHVLKGSHQGWKVEPLDDAGEEFEKWMEEK